MTAPDHAPSPSEAVSDRLQRALHGIDSTRFDSRLGRLVPLGLAAIVALVAATLGGPAALGAAIAIAVGLAITVVVLEHDRWRAQDVLHWYHAARAQRWRVATGSDGPRGHPAAAAVWLGAHQPGTVPQRFRAIAAVQSGEAIIMDREIAALPDATPDDRAWRMWVIATRRLLTEGEADVVELRELVRFVADADDRVAIETWLAQVDALHLHARGDRAWLAPLVAQWSRAPRVPLGWRHTTRLWLSRFVIVPVFAISALALGGIGLQLASHGNVPADYARTAFSTRGDVGDIDGSRLVASMPALAQAVSTATRIEAQALDADRTAVLITSGLPTLIWDTHRINLAPPPGMEERHVWSIEVLLGGSGPRSDSAIMTFDREDGPAYLYGVDPEVVESIRHAVGLQATRSPRGGGERTASRNAATAVSSQVQAVVPSARTVLGRAPSERG